SLVPSTGYAIAISPSSAGALPLTDESASARSNNVFFTTLYAIPSLLSARRRSVASCPDSPEKRTNTADETLPRIFLKLSKIDTFFSRVRAMDYKLTAYGLRQNDVCCWL